MAMIVFFIAFVFIGAMISLFQHDDNTVMMMIIAITVLWAFAYGPWAVATFFELLIGHSIISSRKS